MIGAWSRSVKRADFSKSAGLPGTARATPVAASGEGEQRMPVPALWRKDCKPAGYVNAEGTRAQPPGKS